MEKLDKMINPACNLISPFDWLVAIGTPQQMCIIPFSAAHVVPICLVVKQDIHSELHSYL